ncbi:MAG: DNA polymerase III subunit delta [Deltaproteobacteria bacterium]|nr:DNA polymerase III subunit delta [Deltaproteobacteria bacterium]
MARDLQPEDVLERLEKGRLDPFYLFHGPGEFRMERVLDRIRADFIPEGARDFNLEILYADKKLDPEEIVGRARSVPFMAPNRLIVVRRTEAFIAERLARLIPYLEQPAETTCLIFTSSQPNFSTRFYKAIRKAGLAVAFNELTGKQVAPWIRRTAGELGLELDREGCDVLQEVVGNRLRDLHGELEKLRLRHGEGARVGAEEVRELAVHSRSFTIFELMNRVSVKDTAGTLSVLGRFLEEEGPREASLGIIGMLNRQVRLLWQAKSLAAGGERVEGIAREPSVPPFAARRLLSQCGQWSEEALERAIYDIYEADGRLKTGSRPNPLLESLFIELCR